ncbi:hypothetical protein SO802_009239 [Lithocarpus litseifolius]|uniref:Uncharacterized protein n=1 Tax=Lithocarpus litseifolius TaxID=425828 RepID=A0AAW2DBE1_9ROSI
MASPCSTRWRRRAPLDGVAGKSYAYVVNWLDATNIWEVDTPVKPPNVLFNSFLGNIAHDQMPKYLVAESGKIEMAATCGMVAGYDGFSLGVETLIDVGIKAWVVGDDHKFRVTRHFKNRCSMDSWAALHICSLGLLLKISGKTLYTMGANLAFKSLARECRKEHKNSPFSHCRPSKSPWLDQGFPWVRRSGNSATHVAAKLSLNSSMSLSFNNDKLPSALSKSYLVAEVGKVEMAATCGIVAVLMILA